MEFYSRDFLSKLDKERNKEVYAKIIALDFNENPIELITGRVTAGSINIDGAAAVRRTCSVTITADSLNYDNYLWGLNTKFKLEIGLKNDIDKNYEDIIWFRQGVYVLTSFNVSRSATNFSINISGKDKMCLLNGEIGGTLNSSIDFGTIQEENKDGDLVIKKLDIRDIIRNIVHVYGNEPYYNIIINDLDSLGKELLEYRYDTPIYLYKSEDEGLDLYYDNVLMEDDTIKAFIKKGGAYEEILLKDLSETHLEPLVTTLTNEDIEVEPVYIEEKEGNVTKKIPYYLMKIEYGQTAGYRLTNLTYAGDLIAKSGESITSVLDKIKNMLVEFEYFYNLDGQFVFQKKPSFIATAWFPEQDDEKREDQTPVYTTMAQTLDYTFFQGELITAFNNSPNLSNVKNDYTIGGERTGVSGAKIPIHLRYAIDSKPSTYKTIIVENNNPEVLEYNKKYNVELKFQPTSTTYTAADTYKLTKSSIECDWREVLYQMAKDYFKYNHLTDFEQRVAFANPNLFPTGITGYEQYYTDIYSFWRELYYPKLSEEFGEVMEEYIDLEEDIEDLKILLYGIDVSWNTNKIGGLENDISLLQNYLTEEKDLQAQRQVKEWNDNKVYPIYVKDNKPDSGYITEPTVYLNSLQAYYFKKTGELNKLEEKLKNLTKKKDKLEEYLTKNFYTNTDDGKKQNWNKNVYTAPHLLNFWFDFLDNSSELSKYSVRNIGNRPKTVQDTNIKSIYFRETPEIIFKHNDDEVDYDGKIKVIQIPFIETMFTISAQGKSAKEKLDELLNQHSCMMETATITTIPIYYLQPNHRIKVSDKETKLNGDYIINKITIPLTYNGTMSLSVTKTIDDII